MSFHYRVLYARYAGPKSAWDERLRDPRDRYKLIKLLGIFFFGLQLIFPMKLTFLEPLITSYNVLKALWHLAPAACPAFSSAFPMGSR